MFEGSIFDNKEIKTTPPPWDAPVVDIFALYEKKKKSGFYLYCKQTHSKRYVTVFVQNAVTGEFCGKTELFQEQVFNIHLQRNQPTLFRECTIASTSECVEMST